MKAISLWQPWATLMALDLKKNETRTWTRHYTGPIAIHAAQRTIRFQDIPDVIEALGDKGIDIGDLPMPLGKIVCVRKITGYFRTDHFMPPELEFYLGNYSPGRWVWTTKMVQALEPIPYSGHRKIFEIPDELFI